jgi:protoheme IX farnesyltransferase
VRWTGSALLAESFTLDVRADHTPENPMSAEVPSPAFHQSTTLGASAAGDQLAGDPAAGSTSSLNPPNRSLGGIRQVIADYIALMKPGILTLLLATTLAGMMVAAEGFPDFSLVVWTMIGGLLSAGGANTLNCYIDRDIDKLMARTRNRPSAAGRIAPKSVLTFGIALTVVSFFILGIFANLLAAFLALIGCLYYVLVYTLYLKRRTPQNIVIGGAAGAMPPVVGWAAVTGGLGVAPVLMFMLIYYWTPPHFWALALLKQGDYGRAAVPMLPVVEGEAETRRQIILYTILMVAVSLLLMPFGLGEIYFVSAIALGAIFLLLSFQLYRTGSKHFARLTFFYSLWYLALIFTAMVVDRVVLGT